MRCALIFYFILTYLTVEAQQNRISLNYGLGFFPEYKTESFIYEIDPSSIVRLDLTRQTLSTGKRALYLGGYLGFQRISYSLIGRKSDLNRTVSTNLYEVGPTITYEIIAGQMRNNHLYLGLRLYTGAAFYSLSELPFFVAKPHVYASYVPNINTRNSNGFTLEFGINHISQSEIQNHPSIEIGYVRKF